MTLILAESLANRKTHHCPDSRVQVSLQSSLSVSPFEMGSPGSPKPASLGSPRYSDTPSNALLPVILHNVLHPGRHRCHGHANVTLRYVYLAAPWGPVPSSHENTLAAWFAILCKHDSNVVKMAEFMLFCDPGSERRGGGGGDGRVS